ncbi:hypothetical protein O6H91_07G045400 [Diphasiastrum complanatum]|uniref:Uncharacterized protein n=1 Tax=Diphasiastrum complanatum TaxID=34168 RepID=A0ACC2D4R0_DIPCM|nr:hypothetical protein O6H91_07G045400 [Diphasiastrum complanatum]
MEKSVYALEVMTLLWSHPFLAGLLLLPFTTPICHVVVFFSPLLISTTLCVMALVSIGPEMEAISEERERLFKILGLTFRVTEVERPAARYRIFQRGRNPRLRVGWPRRLGAGERWADWVRGIEIHGQSIWLADSHFISDIAEEGLKADFSDEDGGIAMVEENFSQNGVFTAANDGVSITLAGVDELMLNLSFPFCDLVRNDTSFRSSHLNLYKEKNHLKVRENMAEASLRR